LCNAIKLDLLGIQDELGDHHWLVIANLSVRGSSKGMSAFVTLYSVKAHNMQRDVPLYNQHRFDCPRRILR
jgi:hypothetical protein